MIQKKEQNCNFYTIFRVRICGTFLGFVQLAQNRRLIFVKRIILRVTRLIFSSFTELKSTILCSLLR